MENKQTVQSHIRFSGAESAKYAIIPGDPARVGRVSEFLEEAKEVACNREYRSVRGKYRGIPVLAVSTGIGGPSAAIAVEELVKTGVDTIIRIGSCGALLSGIMIGDLIISAGSVRDDGASGAYVDLGYPAVPDIDVVNSLAAACREKGFCYYTGITRSHDSYYADGAAARSDYWKNRGVLGEDLETAALFVAGRLRGVRTGSILNVVVEAGGELTEGINEYVDREERSIRGEDGEIVAALEAIAMLEHDKLV